MHYYNRIRSGKHFDVANASILMVSSFQWDGNVIDNFPIKKECYVRIQIPAHVLLINGTT